jgi:hypothetical protein
LLASFKERDFIMSAFNIFNDGFTYANSWEEVENVAMPESLKINVSKIKVVDSQYGKSACFFMKSGGLKFFPIHRDLQDTLEVEQVLDPQKVRLIVIQREGDGQKLRIGYED